MIFGTYAIIAVAVAVWTYYEDIADLHLYADRGWLVYMVAHGLVGIMAAGVGLMWPLIAVFAAVAMAPSAVRWIWRALRPTHGGSDADE